MSTIDFIPFATGGGANVVSQGTYVGAAWVGSGFAAGIAPSNQLNKVWRQSSFVAAAVATYISNQLSIDVLDDGVLATFVANLALAIPQPMLSVQNLVLTATGNTGATLTADFATLRNAAGGVIRLATFNLALVATANGANGLDVGSALGASADYHIYFIYNPTTVTKAVIASTNATAPTLPAGYTHYAYAGTLKTDATSHFLITIQRGARTQYIVGTNPTTIPRAVTSTGTIGGGAVFVAFQVRGTGANIFAPANCTEVDVVLMAWSISAGGGITFLQVAPNANYGSFASGLNPPPAWLSVTDNNGSLPCTFVLESDNLYWLGGGNTGRISVHTRGWRNPVQAS